MKYWGKDLKGKELGKGLCQRKDGLYQARVYKPGYSVPIYLYNAKLSELKRERETILQKQKAGASINQITQTVNHWFEEWMKLYVVGRLKATTIRNYIASFNRGKNILVI